MAIATDIAIDSSGNIYYKGAVHGAAGAGYYTVLELHRFLQDLADDASASGDDLIDITSVTPSDRSTDNIITVKTGYQLDDANASATDAISEHLYDGSIVQEGDGTIFDGMLVIAAEGMDLQILQNGAIVTNDFWNTIPNGETTKGLNRDTANGISHRFLLKVDNAGSEIDGRRLIGMTRETGFSYSEFKINGTSRGNNVLALTYAADINDTTDASGRTTITNTQGYRSLDISGDGTPEPYYSEWNLAGFTSKEFYERMKYITRRGETSLIYGLEGRVFRGVTHQLDGTQSSGTFVEPESLSWTGGTGQLLAIDSTTAGTQIWMQILTGTAPTTGNVTGNGGAIFAVSSSTERTVSTPFCGQSTGSAIIGAYGFGVEVADTSASDTFTDLDANTVNPPNNVTFTVNGIITDEDRVLVGPANGSALRTDQFDLNTAVTGASTSVIVETGSETIGASTPNQTDTPTSGTLRVKGDDGVYHRVPYTGLTKASTTLTFTGCSNVPTASIANDVFISYIDKVADSVAISAGSLADGTVYIIDTPGDTVWTSYGASSSAAGTIFTMANGPATGTGTAKPYNTSESYTTVFSTGNPRSLFIRVRDGGTAGDTNPIKTFESTGTLGSAGGTSTAIRTSDA